MKIAIPVRPPSIRYFETVKRVPFGGRLAVPSETATDAPMLF
jgi:hypothetical protein